MRRKRFVHNISSEKVRFRNRFSHNVIDQTRNDGTSRESSYPILTRDNDAMDLDYDNAYDHNYDEMAHVHVKESNKESSSSGESSSSEEEEEEEEEEDDDDDDDDNNKAESSSSGESSEESINGDDDDDDDNNKEESSSSGESSEESNNGDDGGESLEENNEEYEDNNTEESSSSSSSSSSEESSKEDNEVDDDDDEGSLSEDDAHYQIVDEALDKTKMPQYNIDNEFTSYFENFTTASMFCWLQKHNVFTSAYEDLAEIICNPQFNPTHVVKNVRRFRTWRQRLPLLSPLC